MRGDYADWLRERGYKPGPVSTQLSRVRRVEAAYGDLDDLFASEGLEGLVEALRYSAEDERHGKPNTTLIPFEGDIRTNLASYCGSVRLYHTFCIQGGANDPVTPAARPSWVTEDEPERDRRTLHDFHGDGLSVLEAVIAQSRYGTVEQAIASLTLFSHPGTVEQTGCKGVFPTVRGRTRVGERTTVGPRRLMFDDNKSPTDAFMWANAMSKRGRDTQFNHVYPTSGDPDAYTSLANLCMTPAFLAKLTDTSPRVCELLKFRSYHLYQWTPEGMAPPEMPPHYDRLDWANTLPETPDLAIVMKRAMDRRPKDRTVVAARELGWLFSGDVGALG